jgi:SAM-dependent methyltransferase
MTRRKRSDGKSVDLFDEDAYLLANPDVAHAVASGSIPSGAHHFEIAGQFEGRPLSHSQSRNSIVRAELDVSGRGIELGPLDKPIMAKRDGYQVEIVDYLEAAALRAQYGQELHVGVDASLIEEVDHVSRGETLTELIGNEGAYEWVVASHVIEHIPDIVSFLQDVERILSPTGRLGLVVPDKRFCFDFYGELSTSGQIVDAFVEKRTKPTLGQVVDYFSRTSQVNGAIAWGQTRGVVPQLMYAGESVRDGYRRSIDGDDFGGEIHCWRFTPESFRLIIADLRALGLTSLGIVAEHETIGIEFFVTLGQSDEPELSSEHRQILIQDVQDSDPKRYP